MFSPPNHPSVTAWFARLDAAWRRMPAEERDRQREEIEQHLEGLVAANVAQGQPLEAAWEAALVQFGDPTQIGRKMYQEWQQGRTGFRADMKAILFGTGLAWLQGLVIPLYQFGWLFWMYLHKTVTSRAGTVQIDAPLSMPVRLVIVYSLALLLCVAIGRKYPWQAIKSAFYATLIVSSWQLAYVLFVVYSHPNANLPTNLLSAAMISPLYSLISAAVAYFVSVTKRGWYRPSLADFKITLPRRRFKTAR